MRGRCILQIRRRRLATVPLPAFLCALFLSSCNGEPYLGYPSAVIVIADLPVIGQPLQIDGSRSSDPEGRTLKYTWRFVSLPQDSLASLNDTGVVAPSFIPDQPGTYVIELVISIGGRDVDTVSAEVQVSRCGGYDPIVSSIDYSPLGSTVFEPVQLSSTVSDTDNEAQCGHLNQRFTYDWQLQVVPRGSLSELIGSDRASPWFQPDIPGDYVVFLQVTDSTGRSSKPEEVEIEVRNAN